MNRWCLVLSVLLFATSPVAAQSTYVGAALVGDVARFSKVDYGDGEFARLVGGPVDEDGEALGFNVRLGRAFTDRWGLEFEFARSGEFESSGSFGYLPVLRERLDRRVPDLGLEYESERRHTSLAALGFVRQELGDRIELSYLAGVAFSRVETEQEYDGPRILIYPPIPLPNYETTTYDVGAALGFEAAFEFGAAAVTTGVRLQSATAGGGTGWLIRPNVGMRWTF